MRAVIVLVCSLVVSMSAIAADVKVYGKINLSVNQSDNTKEQKWSLNSNSSRLGFKGSQVLSSELKAIYKMEYGINADGGQGKDVFSQRNIYVGLQSNLGTLIAGRHDTPFKSLLKKAAQTDDLQLADLKEVLTGKDRANNILMYSSPRLSGVKAIVAIMPGEGADGRRLADYRSYVLDYTQGPLSVALGRSEKLKNQDINALSAKYKAALFEVAAAYQQAESTNSDKETDAWVVSAAAKVSNNIKLKAVYGERDISQQSLQTEQNKKQMVLAADYKLSKKAKAFSYAAQTKEGGAKQHAAGLGLEVKF